MAIEVIVKPEDVDAMVRDALIKSTLGKLISDAISAACKLGSYNSPIDEAVKSMVRKVTEDILRDEYEPKLREQIAAALSERMTTDVMKSGVDSVVNKFIEKLNESRY